MRRSGSPGTLKLGHLNVLWDDNRITIDGSTDLSRNEDIIARYQASKWHTVECDGLDFDDVDRALAEAAADPRPSLIRCRTIIGFGAPNLQGTAATHGAALGQEEVEATRAGLGLEPKEFTIPDDVLAAWREFGKRGSEAREAWTSRLNAQRPEGRFPRSTRRQGRRALARALSRRIDRDQAQGRDPQGVGNGAGEDQPRGHRDHRRIGRPHRLQQYQDQGARAADRRQLRRPLHLLRHPRVRHGRGDERHGAARRRHPLWRHVHGLHRLCARRRSASRRCSGRGSSTS